MKRAESSSLQVLLFGAALVLVSLGMSTASARNPSLARFGSLIIEELLYPFRQTAASSFRSVSGFWSSYLGLRAEAERAAELDVKNAQLEKELRELRSVTHENEHLRNLLEMKKRDKLAGVVATIIGWEPSAWLRSITIDKGRRDGVEIGDAVVANGAVVGQIMSISLRSSRVLLLVDAGSGIAATVESSGARGVVMGRGKELCVLQYVDATQTLTTGDRVVTSGLDEVFPRGLEIGRIEKAEREENSLFYTTTIRPSVHLNQLTDVLVVKKKEETSSHAAKINSSTRTAPSQEKK